VIYDDAVAVDVNGRAAFLQDMQSDGRVFGSQVLWTDELGRLVSVEWREVDQDVLALARNVVAASAAEWGLLLRSLAIETQIGTPTSDVSEIVVVDEGTGPDRYRLVALVPAGYPLAEEDRRQTCYRHDLGDDVGTRRCDEHSWWGRSASNVFVYGRAPAGVEQVTVSQYDLNPPSTDRPTNGADDTSTVTATVQPTPGPPGRRAAGRRVRRRRTRRLVLRCRVRRRCWRRVPRAGWSAARPT